MESSPEVDEGESTPGRIRTYDPRLRRPMLYPTELRALENKEYRQAGFERQPQLEEPTSVARRLKISSAPDALPAPTAVAELV